MRPCDHPDREVRLFVAQALGELHDPRAAEPLERMLSDEQILVGEKAAKALA
ncbi:MAG: HEAT repeat domain-containing protein, partial [Anaerolineae bacterium]|nr:HEAT repeat domain-containing protein [Anaerolineae bacterium]